MHNILRILSRLVRINQVFSPTRIMVLGFLLIILAGAGLLGLPVSTASGEAVPFLTALFTATSASCVTGLIVVDTAQTWSFFGRVVILLLIQVGGLGFMTVMTVFFFMARRRISVSQRMLMVQSLSLKDMGGVVKLVRHVLVGTLIIEGTGALLLWIRFSFDFGVWRGLGMGIWHSVSAFCNAGFDLMGNQAAFSSLTAYSADVTVNIVISLLIILGGLGFFVWEDIWQNRSFKRLHVYSKMVLCITGLLLLLGWVLFLLAEMDNPATLGPMPWDEKLLASLFQSATTRTAGFNSIDQMGMTDASKLLTILWMFIGGSAGSTAGGIKTVTMGIVVLSSVSSLRGKKYVSVFGRNITAAQILTALSVMMVAFGLCFVCSMIISLTQDIPYFEVLYETVSALATVGLTTGITPQMVPLSQVLLILLMFFGRVGLMTIGLASVLRQGGNAKVKYPDAWLILG